MWKLKTVQHHKKPLLTLIENRDQRKKNVHFTPSVSEKRNAATGVGGKSGVARGKRRMVRSEQDLNA